MNEYNDKDLAKISFIYKAIEDGWSVKKKNNTYIFKKKHENQKKICFRRIFKEIYTKI